ncbi:MAG: NADH-quinone oxidoreductase subunit N [Armatimonadetes bacterium]|nr:NADH-quinone oxidoreductase subunit N [Armatimonadota bacterium]
MNYTIPTVDWSLVLPFALVALTGIVALIIETAHPKRDNGLIIGVSLTGLAATFVLLLTQLVLPPARTFGNMVLRDQFSVLLQLICVAATAVCFMFSDGYLREKKIAFGEFYPLTLWALSGAMVMVSTDNLLMLFVGLEILSIALYCLAGMSRSEARSEESALKYFLLGAFASAFLLYGIAFLFGASGSMSLPDIQKAVTGLTRDTLPMPVFGVMLVLVGLGFKASLVPFHQWTPDVYQGAPTNVTAFMAAVSKVAAFGALARVLVAAAPLHQYWFEALYWIAIATMCIGNLVALVQKDVKRALGYSSIAHAGYLLVALLAYTRDPDKVSLGTTVFYLIGYAAMTVGAFAVVSLAAKGDRDGSRYQDLHGLYRRAPFATVMLVLFLSSLIGIPPTVGFFGKQLIFLDALRTGLVPLAIVLAVNSAVSAYYYLQIMVAAFVSEEGAARPVSRKPGAGMTIGVCVCAAGVIFASLLGGYVQETTRTAALQAKPVPGRVQNQMEVINR